MARPYYCWRVSLTFGCGCVETTPTTHACGPARAGCNVWMLNRRADRLCARHRSAHETAARRRTAAAAGEGEGEGDGDRCASDRGARRRRVEIREGGGMEGEEGREGCYYYYAYSFSR
ncbi:hypothetical protein VTH06DRAFT_2004 [Thermothelomyces fergusii]